METGTFFKAAERRHVTQPAFSRRIRQLKERPQCKRHRLRFDRDRLAPTFLMSRPQGATPSRSL
ncbi:LysR family transcriptional regulator [Halomonas sp. PR-M31]|uniref:helix-turn-helix domain-containing protein n=1 Tax=Halomonas sp. PR-M31 TaxID=1471202 RepID=UPI0034605488